MITRVFPKAEMLELLDGSSKSLKEVSRTQKGKARWSIQYDLIFKEGDKFYRAFFEKGATELQKTTPWEWETEVVAIQVFSVTQYETMP